MAASHSARKYLLYAAGEIALVVGGILIALQVNNANSYRLEVNALEGNLSYVLEDFENNRSQLEVLKSARMRALGACTEAINAYKDSSPLSQSEFIERYVPVVVELRFEPGVSGLERVRSSEIFESESLRTVQDLLREYEELIDANRYTESKLNAHVEAMEEDLFSNGFYDEIWGLLRSEFIDPERFDRPAENPDMAVRMRASRHSLASSSGMRLKLRSSSLSTTESSPKEKSCVPESKTFCPRSSWSQFHCGAFDRIANVVSEPIIFSNGSITRSTARGVIWT